MDNDGYEKAATNDTLRSSPQLNDRDTRSHLKKVFSSEISAETKSGPIYKWNRGNCGHEWGNVQFCCHLKLLLDRICYKNLYI